jgi:hypothetical protein
MTPANYRFWARAKVWTKEECLALALGAEPIYEAPDDPLRSYRADHRSGDQREYEERMDRMAVLIVRHFGHLPHGATITPTVFLHWLKELELWIPDGMAEAVERFDGSAVDWKVRAETAERSLDEVHTRLAGLEAQRLTGADAPVATRERESLLKLVIGMAIGGYGFDPKASRSPIPAQIASDLQTGGLSITDDTVRKYLREGAELLPLYEAD